MSQPSTKRGRTHNAEGAREAILNAAEQVFAEHGFDGTRVDTIAEAAGYNKSLIFQYFDDKLNLYASVVRRADEQTRGFQNQVFGELLTDATINDANQIKTLLRSLLSAYFDYLVAHPRLVRILNWEMAEGWQTYSKIATERDQADINTLNLVMQKVEESGLLRSPFNVTGQLILALVSSHLYLGLMPLFNLYLPNFASQSEDGLAQAREFLIEFVIHGLIANSDEAHS